MAETLNKPVSEKQVASVENEDSKKQEVEDAMAKSRELLKLQKDLLADVACGR